MLLQRQSSKEKNGRLYKMVNKKLLRQQAIARRKELSDSFMKKSSEVITGQLSIFFETKKISKIFMFFAMHGEVDLSHFFKEMKYALAFPRVVGDDLEFYKVDDSNQLQKQAFGIWEPINGLERVYPDTNSVILVPALLLARDGSRLGHGKGFYDRFLAEYLDVLSIGVVFEPFIVEKLPVDVWDVPLGGICSEARLEILRQII